MRDAARPTASRAASPRARVLGGIVAVGCLSIALQAAQQTTAPVVSSREVQVEKVRSNLYVLRGGGGVSAAFVTSTNGVVLVDTKWNGWGQAMLDAVRTFTERPVTTIINTHTHFDHVNANVEFAANVEVVAHENTKRNMEQMRPVTGITMGQIRTLSGRDEWPPPNVFKEHEGRGLPRRTFTDRMTIGAGPDAIDLYYFGRGHTDGDAWVVFRALRVMHAGDMFPGKAIPLLDANNGGSGVLIADTLAKAAAGVNDVDTIITGHGALATPADLREYVQFNREFLQLVRQAKDEGRSVDEVVWAWRVPEKYVGYAVPDEVRLRSNVQVIFNELK